MIALDVRASRIPEPVWSPRADFLQCLELSPHMESLTSLFCTRPDGHPGLHVATDGESCLAVWGEQRAVPDEPPPGSVVVVEGEAFMHVGHADRAERWCSSAPHTAGRPWADVAHGEVIFTPAGAA